MEATSGAGNVPVTLPLGRLATTRPCRLSVNSPTAERLALMSAVQGPVPVQSPPTQPKRLPTSGWPVSTTEDPSVTRRETEQLPMQVSGGVSGAVMRPPPLPEAATLSVRAATNFLCTVRLAVMSTRQTEPFRREHPVQETNRLSVPANGVSATT